MSPKGFVQSAILTPFVFGGTKICRFLARKVPESTASKFEEYDFLFLKFSAIEIFS